MKEYKYKTRFECVARCLVGEDQDKFLAKASLENLKSLLPPDIDLNEKEDCIAFVANGTVINRGNKNRHLITSEDAARVAKNFELSFCDIEHKRNLIVGVITSTGFSEFGSNKLITEANATATKEPYNLAVSGLVWKVAQPGFTKKLLESNDPSSAIYQQISLSWELAYDEYDILLGSPNLVEGELVTDEAKKEELSKYLKGDFKAPDGREMYIVIKGPEIVSLGFGFTLNPAADVKGVYLIEPEEKSEVDASSKENKATIIESDISPQNDIIEKSIEEVSTSENDTNSEGKQYQIETIQSDISKKNISHTETLCVKRGNMKFTTVEELSSALKEAKASEEVVASAVSFFNDEIKKANEKYVAEKSAKEDMAAKVKQLETELETAKNSVAQVTEQLDKMNQEKAAAEKEQKFQDRMQGLKDEYELDEEDVKQIVAQISDLDDAGWEKWYSGFKVFARAKSKSAIAAEKEKKTKETQASIDPAAATEEALKNAKETSAAIPNASTPTTSLKDKYKNLNMKDHVEFKR